MNRNIKPLLLAHRGYTRKFQENTMEAYFDIFLQKNIDGIEIDVAQTKDKQLICFHDYNLNRLLGINKNINQVNFDEIKNNRIKKNIENGIDYQFKPKITKFVKLLNLFMHSDKLINIELKIEEDDPFFVINVTKEIEKRKMEHQVIITSFNHKLLRYVDSKKFKIGSLNDYDLCKNDINKMNLNYPIVILDKRTDKKILQKLKKMNKTIGIYTINSYNDNLKDDLRFYSEVDYFIFDRLIE